MKRIWVSLGLMLLAGCAGQTAPSNFYALSANASPRGLSDAESKAVSVGIGPVTLPVMLDRPQIVTREGNNRLGLSEFQRWAGSLSSEVPQVLAQNLMQELGTDRIASYPWPRYRRIDYQVVVDVFRFDGLPGQSVILEGVWTLVRGDGEEELEAHGFREQVPVAGNDFESLVASHSVALARLGARIAEVIRARAAK